MARTAETPNNPWNEYTRNYRKRHPEMVKKSRINYAKKLLTDNGYTVIPPAESQQPQEETPQA